MSEEVALPAADFKPAGVIRLALLGCLAAVLALWWSLSPAGLGAADWQILLLAATPLAITAMAQTLPIVAGGQGLSAGATLVLVTAMVATRPISTHLDALFAIGGGLLVGLGVGLVNGVLIGLCGLRSTPVTLATGALAMAYALLHLGDGYAAAPDILQDLLYGWTVYDVSVLPVLILALVCAAGELFLKGRDGVALRARGDGPGSGARLGGRPVVLAYVAAGAGAGFGGVLLAAAFGSVDAAYGAPALLQILAAIALGGGIPGLGGGSVSGSLLGALIVVATGNLLLPLGIQDYYASALDAGWLLAGLLLSTLLLRPRALAQTPAMPAAAGGWPLIAASCAPLCLLLVNLRPEARDVATIAAGSAILAASQAAILRAGIVDLSMPALISASAIATVSLANGSDARLAIFLPVLLGSAVILGCLHGILALRLKRAAMLATLATAGIAQAASAATLVLLPTGYTPPVLYKLTVLTWLGVPAAAWLLAAIGVALVAWLGRPSSGPLAMLPPFVAGSLASAIFGMSLAGFGGSAHFSVIDSYFLPAIAAAMVAGNLASAGAPALAGCLALALVAADTGLVALGADYATRIFALSAVLVLGEGMRAAGVTRTARASRGHV